jgi:hypothetical protein
LSLCACTIYSPDLLTSTGGAAGAGGASGAAGAGNPCGTGSKCKDAGPDGSSGAGGAAGSGGAAGAGGAVVPDDAPSFPYVTSTTLSPSIGVGLSLEGTLDWAHWGLKMATDYNHKVLNSPLISLSTATAKPRSVYTGTAPMFAWSDGTPTVSGNTSNGTQFAGAAAGDGFIVTAPASADLRSLRLYLGVFDGTGEITMTLSSPGGDGALNVDSSNSDSLTSATETWNVQVVTIRFLDANPKSMLTVSWVLKGVSPSIKTAIHLAAATMQLAQ